MIPVNNFIKLVRGAMPESLSVKMIYNRSLVGGQGMFTSSYIESLPYFAQSNIFDGGNNNNEVVNQTVVCDTDGVTCFTETAGMVSREAKTHVPSDIELYNETIGEFLRRPLLLDTVTFATTDAVNSNLYNQTSIGSLLDLTTLWTDKIAGYGLFKGTFVLRLELNASPFQMGSMLLHYIPCFMMIENSTNKFNANIVQKMQHPHIVVTTYDTSAEIEIPFVTPESFYRMQSKSANTCDWGGVFLDVLTPLRIGATATQTSFNIQVYGFWKDVELAAPMIAQSSGSIRRKGKVNVDSELNPSGKIGPALMSIGTGLSSLADVPVIGSFMTPLSWVARATGAVASAFGYSKPQVGVTQSPMFTQPLRYIGNSDGPDTAITLASGFDNTLGLDDTHGSCKMDEMSYAFLLRHITNYVGRHVWNATDVADTTIMSRLIRPSSMYDPSADVTISGSSHTTLVQYGGPIYYLGNVHRLYRGSFKLHLKFIKTNFHSGKIMITFTPATNVSTQPTINNSALSIRQIIDIRELSEVTLTLPYMIASEYLTIHPNDDFDESSIGTLTITVLNQLRNPETVSSSIDILESYTAGDDFELAMPCAPHYGHLAGVSGRSLGLPFIAQSSSTIVNRGIGDTVEHTRKVTPSTMCIGETINSVKQLVNRYSFMQSVDPAYYVNNEIYPWFSSVYTVDTTTGDINIPLYQPDAFSYFSMMYLFSRGSMRVLASSSSSLSDQKLIFGALSARDPSNSQFTNAFVRPSTGNPGGFNQTYNPLTDSGRVLFTNSVSSSTLTDGFSYFRVPYQSRFPVMINQPSLGSTDATNTNFEPATRLVLSSGASNLVIGGLARSVGDDFQFLYFINTPGVIVEYNPVEV